MSDPLYDVVVIGGGMAGLAAALRLLRAGLRVALVSKGDPLCCVSTGCIDVLGTVDNPLDGLAGLPPEHPYHLAGRQNLEESLALFSEIMAQSGLAYAGDPAVNREILTPLGTIKRTCLVPQTMEQAHGHAADYLHVVSFEGLKDFYPSYITARLAKSGFSVFDAGVGTTLGLAQCFDEPDFLAGFIDWLRKLEMPPGRIALPAVLGLRDPAVVLCAIAGALERQVFEIPTLPPSLPGLRLFRRLRAALLSAGGHVFWGKEIASIEKSGRQVEALTLQTAGRPTRVHGRAFILATGAFISGGLFAYRDAIEETVLDLPVFLPGPREDWFHPEFFRAGHAIEKAGVEVQPDFRPREGGLENVFVCGSLLAGAEIMKNRCGHGLALATGYAAAGHCAGSLE